MGRPSACRGMRDMAIPSTVPQTAAGYIDYLASQINLADKMWTHYAWAVSGAYAKAYGLNSGALREAKVVIERQKQSDYDRMSFALSLLTVGVAGATAGAVARSMYESKKLEDAAKDIIKRALQQPAGAV